jgi:hypothetical protein
LLLGQEGDEVGELLLRAVECGHDSFLEAFLDIRVGVRDRGARELLECPLIRLLGELR